MTEPFDLLAKLERDVLDETVSLAGLLRTCLMLAGWTQAAQLRQWATGELKGYDEPGSVPEYRVIAAPIVYDVVSPFAASQTRLLNTQELPEEIRKHINERVPLNQSIDQLEIMVAQAEGRAVELSVFGGDIFMKVWNQNPRGERIVRMCWWIHPSVIRGVLGQVRTALTEFVVGLRTEVGDSDELPSAKQTDEAVRSAVQMTFNDSTIVFADTVTSNGDFMPSGPRTTIKDNKYKFGDVKGNVAAGSADFTQAYQDTIDVAKIREFTELITEIAPNLDLGPDAQAELETSADELRAATGDPAADRGRLRRAVDHALRVLRLAGPGASTVLTKVAIAMGDQIGHELGEEIARQLPH